MLLKENSLTLVASAIGFGLFYCLYFLINFYCALIGKQLAAMFFRQER